MSNMTKHDWELIGGIAMALMGIGMMVAIGVVFLDAVMFGADSIGGAISKVAGNIPK